MENYLIIKRNMRSESKQYAGFTKDPLSVELHFQQPQANVDSVGVRIYCQENYFCMGEVEKIWKALTPITKCKLRVKGEAYWLPGRYIAFIYVGESARYLCRFTLSTDPKERLRMEMSPILPDSPGDFYANCLSDELWYQRLGRLGLSARFHMRLLLIYMQDKRQREAGLKPMTPIIVKGHSDHEEMVRYVAEQLEWHVEYKELSSYELTDEKPYSTDDANTLYVEFRANLPWVLYGREHPALVPYTDKKTAELSATDSMDRFLAELDAWNSWTTASVQEADEDILDNVEDCALAQQREADDLAGGTVADDDNDQTPQEKLDALVGLSALKEDLRRASLLALFHKRRRELMLEGDTGGRHHMLFLGNPGTGKTTVARIIGQMYREMGLLSSGHTVVTERTCLIGEFIGQTEGRMKEMIDQARGGVLFIDEAYTLFAGEDDQRDFGKHALECLLTVLAEPNPDMLIIMAGYEKPMQELLKSNPGLRDRFPLKFHFEDFTEEELVEVALRLAKARHYEFSGDAERQLRRIVHLAHQHRDAHFANARWVHNFFEQGIEKCMALRVMSAPSAQDIRTFSLIEASDLLEAERTYLRDTAPYIAPKPRIGFVA